MAPEFSSLDTLSYSDIIASMRPGPIGPGIDRILPGQAQPPKRFNEAGANWPRNSRPRGRSHDDEEPASMRPGPIGPGIQWAALAETVQALGLQ